MLRKIIETAIIATVAAAAVGQLPHFLQAVRAAQLQILKDSESTRWGRPFLLPVHEARRTKQGSSR